MDTEESEKGNDDLHAGANHFRVAAVIHNSKCCLIKIS